MQYIINNKHVVIANSVSNGSMIERSFLCELGKLCASLKKSWNLSELDSFLFSVEIAVSYLLAPASVVPPRLIVLEHSVCAFLDSTRCLGLTKYAKTFIEESTKTEP